MAEHLGLTLSAFEAVTLAALVAFADAPVDVAVVEVGLLGRYGATNVVDGDVAVITSIGGDHTDFSDGWRLRIAQEKAGIVKPASTAVLGPLEEELVVPVREARPRTLVRYGRDFVCRGDEVAVGGRRVEVVTSRGSEFDLTVPLHGSHQSVNVAIAVEAVESLFDSRLAPNVVDAAMDEVRAPGRIEVIAHQPLVVVDGAHNPDAAAALGETLAESFAVPGRRLGVVAMLQGRDPARFLAALQAAFPLDLLVAAALDGPRGLDAGEIAHAAEVQGIASIAVPTVDAAVRRVLEGAEEEDLVVITGSFRVLDVARAQTALALAER
ncbi:MAG: Mur ligase family protein [Microthrixaceae bacterium]